MEASLMITPALFYTLVNGNPRSVNVLVSLRKLLRKKLSDELLPKFWFFGDEGDPRRYCEEHNIPSDSSVAVCDAPWLNGQHFTPVYRGEIQRRYNNRIPPWFLRWGVLINGAIPVSKTRAETVALQMRADFCRRFPDEHPGERAPWGSWPRKKAQREAPLFPLHACIH